MCVRLCAQLSVIADRNWADALQSHDRLRDLFDPLQLSLHLDKSLLPNDTKLPG